MEEKYISTIRKVMAEKGITQGELAEKINKTITTVNNYLNGNSKIDIDTFIKIANTLNVPVSFLLDENLENEKLEELLLEIEELKFKNAVFKANRIFTEQIIQDNYLLFEDLLYYILKIDLKPAKFKDMPPRELYDYIYSHLVAKKIHPQKPEILDTIIKLIMNIYDYRLRFAN